MPRKASARKTQDKTPQVIDPAVSAKKVEDARAALQKAEDDHAKLMRSPEGAVLKHAASTSTMGGVTKILREEGDSNTGKPAPTHVVQQGGGGAVDGNSGQPIR